MDDRRLKYWLARCLAGTLGCAGLAAMALLLAGLLSAGGDRYGSQTLRIAAYILGSATAIGLTALVVLLSIKTLRDASGDQAPPS